MNVGLVGCGYWGKNLLRNFHELGALGAVCDALPAHQERAKEMAPGIPIFSDYEELLRSDIPAVALATPAVTHFEMAGKALAAGKDVFVEKPLSLNVDEGQRLLQKRGDRILMVGHILEYHPACVKLVELARSGELGKLCYIYSNRLSLGKVRQEENILWSFAPHDVALINRIAGTMPETVAAFGGAYVQNDVADVTVTNLTYPNGIRAHIHVSWLHPFKEQRLVVIGDQKMAVFDGVAGDLVLFDQRVEWQKGEPVPIKSDGVKVPVSDAEPLKEECRAFLNAIETRIQPLTDGQNGLEVLSVLESAQESLNHRGRVCHVVGDFASAKA
jgi:predicted dehydrogenase